MAGAFRRAASREMDKLKKMSAGDRIWYLWEYYRFHLFVCLALLAVVGYAGSILYRNLSLIHISLLPSPEITQITFCADTVS